MHKAELMPLIFFRFAQREKDGDPEKNHGGIARVLANFMARGIKAKHMFNEYPYNGETDGHDKVFQNNAVHDPVFTIKKIN